MTDAIPVDLAKAMASTKPIPAPTPGAAPPPKPSDKPAAKPADGKAPAVDKTADAPATPAPGAKTFLGWVARSVSKKQLMVAAAAVGSLAAGIAAVKFLVPQDDFKPDAATTQLTVPEAWPERKPIVPHTGPTLTIEQPKPGDFIPSPGLPVPPVLPATAGGPTSPRNGTPPAPAFEIPLVGDLTGTTPAAPVPPTREKPTLPAPDPLAPPVIPVSGTLPPAPAGDATLPLIPSVGGASGPAAPPAVPALPGTPVVPPAPMGLDSIPKPPLLPEPGNLASGLPKPPPAAVTGKPVEPPTPPAPLVPAIGTPAAIPPTPMDLKPAPASPTTPAAKIEFVKPAESGTVTPAGGTVRQPTTTYDVDIYHPKANDSWEAISREYYNDTKFAAALRAYNNGKALTGTVDVPPIHVLRRTPAPAAVVGTPTSARPASGDPWNAVGAGPGGGKVYRVPAGSGVALTTVAKQLLGSDQRWREIWDLNPNLTSTIAPPGTELKLPADARTQ